MHDEDEDDNDVIVELFEIDISAIEMRNAVSECRELIKGWLKAYGEEPPYYTCYSPISGRA